VKIFGRDVYWSESAIETRSLEQITDLGLAFERVQNDLTGLTEGSVPAVYRARQFLADTVASLHLDQRAGDITTNVTPPLLSEPDPSMTYHEFMSLSMLSLIDHGNLYYWIKGRDEFGNAKSLYVLDPREVSVNWDRRRLYRLYSWRDQNMVPDEDILHIAINRGPGDLKGRGPIEAALATTIQAAKAEEAVARDLAEDNFTPSLVIKTPEVKTEGEAKRVLDVWTAGREQGGRKRPSVMNSNSELEQITFKPIDAQWIEGRNFTVQQIGRLFGIHGFFLLVESGSSLTYSTTESLFRLLLTATLRPTYLERIEQAFSRLLPSGRVARFNTDEILQADIVSRYQAHHTAVGGQGFKTINEVRAEEGLPPIEGGDELLAASVQPKQINVPQLNGATNA
jgi:HK97 family phage portal protein